MKDIMFIIALAMINVFIIVKYVDNKFKTKTPREESENL